MFFYLRVPPSVLVTKREPTPGYSDAYSVGTPKWAFGEKHGQKHRSTTLSPLVRRVFLVNKRTIFFFWGVGDLDAPYRGGHGTLGLVKGISPLISCPLNLSMLVAG